MNVNRLVVCRVSMVVRVGMCMRMGVNQIPVRVLMGMDMDVFVGVLGAYRVVRNHYSSGNHYQQSYIKYRGRALSKEHQGK